MMNKYKTFEELKEELGDKFEEYMYGANIELLTKIDKAKEYIETHKRKDEFLELNEWGTRELLEILGGVDDE